MAKQIKSTKPKKERLETYEQKVSFNSTFEDMIKISATGAGVKNEEKTKK